MTSIMMVIGTKHLVSAWCVLTQLCMVCWMGLVLCGGRVCLLLVISVLWVVTCRRWVRLCLSPCWDPGLEGFPSVVCWVVLVLSCAGAGWFPFILAAVGRLGLGRLREAVVPPFSLNTVVIA